MRLALLLVLLAGACADDHEFGTCPTRIEDWGYGDCRAVVEPNTFCDKPQATDAGTALPESCYCEQNGVWVCNSCPFPLWTPAAPADACTPHTTCVINSWEHGCLCACDDDGTWSCAPQTINSHCP